MSALAVGRVRASGAGEFRPTRHARVLPASDHVTAALATVADWLQSPLRTPMSRCTLTFLALCEGRGGQRAVDDMRLTSIIGDLALCQASRDRGLSLDFDTGDVTVSGGDLIPGCA